VSQVEAETILTVMCREMRRGLATHWQRVGDQPLETLLHGVASAGGIELQDLFPFFVLGMMPYAATPSLSAAGYMP